MDKVTKINIVNGIIIIITLGIIIWLGNEEYIENKIEGNSNVPKVEKAKLTSINLNYLTNNIVEKEYPKEEIITTYRGYEVCAKLEIPKIKLETYVLSNYSTQALNISVTKFWGVDPNEIGNFCVAGHNFINKNMFRNLKKLDVGDKLYIIDNNIGKVEYEVYKIDKVSPKDVSCLEQSNNNRETTLITCTNDSKQRIIVKAKEVK